jgi:hypothetical protein
MQPHVPGTGDATERITVVQLAFDTTAFPRPPSANEMICAAAQDMIIG